MPKSPSKPTRIVLTPEQRAAAERMRAQIEQEKPEILAEGRRVRAAADAISSHLQGALPLLKAVRESQGVTLTELAERTGIHKTALSRLENHASQNVTINTLYRIASALGYTLQVSIVAAEMPKPKQKRVRAMQ